MDEEFTIRLLGHGGEPVEFLQDGAPVEPAEDSATTTARLSRRAPTTITARTVADDGVSANNSRSAVVLPAPRKHVLLVAEAAAAAEPFARLLRQEEFEVNAIESGAFPPRYLNRDYDVVVLLNVAAGELAADGVEQLDRFVAVGGGLVTIGGDATFAREALEGAPLARLLPLVAANRPAQQRETRLGVVLVIDNSRSMLEANRMELAKQAAALAIEPLSENDLLGVIAFGDKSDWISEMIAVGEKSELRDRIDKLEATGVRTIMYPAVRKAFLALAAADVDRRTMIILTDGVSAPGDFERIAREMADGGVRVSTVTVGAGADRTIVQRIADVAGGRHHHAEDPADLPQIVLSEATSAVEEAADEEIRPMVVEPLAGIPLDQLPPLARFTTTDLRPGSRLYLMSPAGDPLLSIVEIGDGKSLALPVDLTGAAAEQWRRWPGYASLLGRLVRLVER
ncbi:MAG: VWA domain-containing protein, partial [Pirellulales bacterium]